MTDSDPHARVVPVVAAVIRRGDRYLVGLRPAHKRHGGLWEFPGGKLLDGEDLLAAARREIHEELDLDVHSLGEVLFEARDPGSPFLVRFAVVEVAAGEPRPIEHERVGWFTVGELADLALAPSDERFVREALAG